MDKSQNKNLWQNDCFAGCVMIIVFTCILALLGIGGGQIWSHTKCGHNSLRQEKVMNNEMHAKTPKQLLQIMTK